MEPTVELPKIEITREEATKLREILVRYLPELRREIAVTERKELRKFLEGFETLMTDLIKRME